MSLLIVLGIYSYFTNPFVRFSVIVDPVVTLTLEDGQIDLEYSDEVFVNTDPFFNTLAKLKSGVHIISNRFRRNPGFESKNVDEVIESIHEARFDPDEPYLISGDHFSVFYPRSIGIFYHSLLDTRTVLSPEDWKHRQLIYLKSISYMLQVFEKSGFVSTTIVPVSPRSVSLMNIYAYPSDTVYSMLYGLYVSKNPDYLHTKYKFGERESDQYDTISIAEKLLDQYKDSLSSHVEKYVEYVQDSETMLVKKKLDLSGTKDMVRKQSGFYDNVILWRTLYLANELGIYEIPESELVDLKNSIIEAFWVDETGLFLEDLSDQANDELWYSSDWLIAYQVDFLDPYDEDDRYYLERSVEYIIDEEIDEPFGLKYHNDVRTSRLYLPVFLGARTYGSTVIWSHWGVEYIKLLTQLAQITGEKELLQEANHHLEVYQFNIERYGGYPEVYNEEGDFFRSLFYESVKQTGWVVNYEEAQVFYDWVNEMWE